MIGGRPCAPALAGALLLAAFFCCGALASDETIHPDSWVYPALRTFELLGLVRLEQAGPFARSGVENAVLQVERAVAAAGIRLTPRQAFLLERLRGEFLGAAADPDRRENPPVLVVREEDRFIAFDFAVGAALRRCVESGRRQADALFVPTLLLGWGERITFATNYRVTLAPEYDACPPGDGLTPRGKSWRGVTSNYERAYVAVSGSGWRLRAGRDYLRWGPARPDALILSPRAGPLDHAGIDLHMGPFTLRAIQAVLDERIPRRLAGHRLEIRLPRGIRAGISETVVYTMRGLDWAYLFPLGSFYANQYNEKEDDNTLWALDMSVPVARGLLLSGELLIDDFQYESDPPAPDRLGATLAADLLVQPRGHQVEIHLSYTRINIFTYAHKDPLLTAYVTGDGDPARGAIIGDRLGPDADRWTAAFAAPLCRRVVLSAAAIHSRRGEGNDLREWDRIEDPRPPLPSGVVRRETTVGLALDADLGGGSSIAAGWGWRFVSSAGVSGQEPFAHLALVWDLR